MTSNFKILQKLNHKGEKDKSLVKDLLALKPITSIVITEAHPLVPVYNDTNPPPQPVDQFTPYLSRKLTNKRIEKIQKLKGKPVQNSKTYMLTRDPQTNNQPMSAQKNTSNREITNMNFLEENPLPQLSNTNKELTEHLQMEALFDKIVIGSPTVSLPRLIESTLNVYFLAETVLFYHDVSSVKLLYCPSTTASCPHGSGIVGYTQFSRKIVNIDVAHNHIAYLPLLEKNLYHPDSRVLCFPLFDINENVVAVIQVIRSPSSMPFTSKDEKFVEYFQSKCKAYSRWLFQPVVSNVFISSIVQTSRLRKFIESTTEKLTRLFGCRGAEIWEIDTQTNKIVKYDQNSKEAVPIESSESGIAGFSLRNQIPISCLMQKVHSSYQQKIDGNGEHSVLAMPIRDPDSPRCYAIVLRGKRIPQFFTDHDEKILVKISPYVIASLNSSILIEKNHQLLKDSLQKQKRLAALLEVAESLSGELKMDVLIPNIMNKACDLVNADRCSLFMVNDTRDKLVTSFQGGLTNSIEVPIHAGIVGYTATTGKILNIQDAYQDPRFNRATDLATGYRTLTLLCVPIFDEKGAISGVVEMINKLDGVFTEEDERMIKIFNIFTGISIENARLYRASIDLSLQLRSFLDISYSLSQPQTIKKLIEEILKNTRKVVGAVRAQMFMIENNGINFTPFVTDEDIEAKIKREQKKLQQESEDNLGVKKAIIQKLLQGKVPKLDDEIVQEENERKVLIENVISTKESILQNDDLVPEKSLMMVPIVSSDRAVMGCVMMQWKKSLQKFTFDDLKLFESYSVFLSISLERSRLKNIAKLGSMEVEMQTWITTNERNESGIPEKLILSDEQKSNLYSINFDICNFNGIGLVKIMFNLFDHFHLFDIYHITNEVFYHFIYNIRESYNQVPYHNWMHAVDVTQFISYELYSTDLENVFTSLEILGMIIAAVCHDANHDGFSNSYNVKAQTPLGILFKNNSVMETHHCTVSISILTKDECNLFKSLSDTDLTYIWNLFISLILATDMAKHFVILENAKKIQANKWTESDEGRLMFMQLLLKCADVSNVARKFDVANRLCDILCEEFFRQGELEKANGMEYTSPMNDREHLDKAKSQIGFYTGVCIPLLELTNSFCPKLKPLVDMAKSNLNVWIKQTKQKDENEKIKKVEVKEEESEEKKKELEIARRKFQSENQELVPTKNEHKKTKIKYGEETGIVYENK
ncbi:3'5'-cyclic nucleotide phosphodiesterase family protein [Histomonas meleagridis]|uniref:3'5'-cyclic nucleotide phosphodiesterase family protein n=1 Tax=Histomonas meleagridis TaxID=135588 RepID=UPI00355A6E85|nr:3'5'-cyclic nucleotide phosphodiesterase family protein [Histomonas meleagridis]KAH0799827.1 3'5'-cyclic nucleotide phosphodiesterase family protein [Histomonas meleagridis]